MLAYLWLNLKLLFVDPTDTPLQASFHNTFSVSLIWCCFFTFIGQGSMWFFNLEGQPSYLFIEKFNLMLLAFAISDYCAYRKVKKFKEQANE